MQLLDATLAFVLTMAALATVVTIIMEVCLRIARLRKRNMLKVMKLLNKELDEGILGIPEEERWAFFVRVVNNPFEAAEEIPKIKWQGKTIEERIASYGKDRKWKGIYEKVSLEYLLRCLAECESVKKASREVSETIKTEFNRLARKYEVFGSAVSGSFKSRARFWSIAIGIILAIFANIDGMRIFESYRTDPKLAAAVIEKQETYLENYQAAQQSLETFSAARDELAALENDLAAAKREHETASTGEEKQKTQARITKLEKSLEEKEAFLEEQLDMKNIQLKARQAQQQLADLVALGVPLGWDLYPNCPYGGDRNAWMTSSPQCQAIPEASQKKMRVDATFIFARILNTALNDPGGFLIWLFIVIITGMLIGLGAPFWFDVAKRLSQIRKGIQKSSASDEYRLSGSNADGDSEKRKEIVAKVLTDAAREAAVSIIADKSSFLGPKGLRL